jgi:nucleoside-diphosphate-sugar epimerase
MQGQSPYSASKIGADRLAESFHRSFELPVVIVRPFNTYGPRQSSRAVIPTIITQLIGGAREIALGEINSTRDFNFVGDTAIGFLSLSLAKNVEGLEVNISSGREVTIMHVAEELISIINPKATVVLDPNRLRPSSSEVMRLLGDSSLLRSLTDWTPSVSLHNGLIETVNWFKNPENLRHYPKVGYTL